MTKTVTATQARKNFFKLLEEAKTPGHFVTITLGGLPAVTLMSAEELDGWMETMEIMADEKLVRGVKKARKEVKSGKAKLLSYEEMQKSLGL